MTVREREWQSVKISTQRLPNGAAAAALLSAAIGCLVIGLMTVGTEVSEGLKQALTWYKPAGPLTGKTGIGIIAWLISWAVLHSKWKDYDVDFASIFRWAIVLLIVGFLLTFPPIFLKFG